MQLQRSDDAHKTSKQKTKTTKATSDLKVGGGTKKKTKLKTTCYSGSEAANVQRSTGELLKLCLCLRNERSFSFV